MFRIAKCLAIFLVAITIAVGFGSINAFASPTTPLQSSGQQSAAWVAAVNFPFGGGDNEVFYGASNTGSNPVVICQSLYAANGTAIWTSCTNSPIPTRGASTGNAAGDAASWSLTEDYLGFYGTVIVYSKDGTTPITPTGYTLIDQQGNKVVNAAFSLTWYPTSAPSS